MSSPGVLSSASQEGVLRGKEKIKNTPTTKIRFTKEEMRQVENMEKYSTSQVIKEMQMKTMGHFKKRIKLAKIFKMIMPSVGDGIAK